MQVENINMAPMGGHLGGPQARSSLSDLDSHHPVHSINGLSSMERPSSEAMVEPHSARALKAGEVFPDLHHKMSKKIAQLTKVIYHLNTKNEDRQASFASRSALLVSSWWVHCRHGYRG